ncbi:peptidoglycan/xylan/chitin deacetylase (PgdA/CDA1 family) [Ochrobactrum sp. 19YEA23]|uniref:polysaccharide deacetylase family protein n=1 Tax=Ochrobactrum sp. 19YEA23 TaxID=3039854 RepID=UPI00247A7A5F|nr:peptidoglycan/xylan/chitin deacetylase (PgdA/CDA1 family) [Ochrobactrum sp. 19YEA23]
MARGAMRSFQGVCSSLRYGMIRAGLELAAVPFVRKLFSGAAGRGVIFTLHHVRPAHVERFSPNAHLSVTPEFLEEAINVAINEGLTPVHLHDLPTLLGDKADRRSFVAFSLDDGYRNNAEFAAPIFRKFSVPYTIFVNPGFVERKRSAWWETAEAFVRKASSFEFDFGNGSEHVRCGTLHEKLAAFDRFTTFVKAIDEDEAVGRIDAVAQLHGVSPIGIIEELVMNEAELRQLAQDPLVHFGAHTMNHLNLRRVAEDRLHQEIEQSAAAIERYVGQKPRSFSYPYGWPTAVGKRETSAIAEAGFAVGVTTQPGVLNCNSLQSLMRLPRVSLNGYYQKPRYVKALISGVPFKFLRNN